MQKYIDRLHFITHDLPHLTHIEQAEKACNAGAKWIQYRCFTKTDSALLQDIHAIAEICDDWGVTLIVTNHIRFARKADIQGFHIEDMNANFVELRQILGEAITIGGSANTVENLIRMAKEGVDYAGFGPFSLTTTKPNDLPLLSPKDYTQAIKALKAIGAELPVLAVGGISLNDIPVLMRTGVFGLAVSNAINTAEDFEEAYQSFYYRILEAAPADE